MSKAWNASASAFSRCAAPSARAIVEATLPPTPPAAIVCISINSGNARLTPARASAPSQPTK
jgi:hypothetical protein